MVMEYGCETWIDSNLSQIFKKLVSIQYEALKRVAEVYNDPASHLLKKEATTLSLRIWLEHVLKLKLIKFCSVLTMKILFLKDWKRQMKMKKMQNKKWKN